MSFLFTSGEESGLVGSWEFVDYYMKANNLKYDLIVNLDCVGSGKPIVISSSNKEGLILNFVPFGEYIFDGDKLSDPGEVWKQDKTKFDGEKFGIKSEPSVVGYSDTYAFLREGQNAIHISSDNMKSIMEYSHKTSDTPDLLSQIYLDSTKSVVVSIGKNYK